MGPFQYPTNCYTGHMHFAAKSPYWGWGEELMTFAPKILENYYHHHRISHFSALVGKYSPSWDVVINRIRLGDLICSLKSFFYN